MIASKNISHLLDKKDLKRQSFELRKICEPLFYKGKGLRSKLVCLVGSHIGLNKSEKLFLSRIIEYIHNSSLLHDDFIDRSRVRRNRKTAWLEFSPVQAVLAGDYLLAKVNIYLARAGNLNLIKKTALTICQLAEGEFFQRQLLFCEDKELKNRDKISELKTASLFKWCLQAPFLLQNRKDVKLHRLLDRLGFSLGVLFQRSDDLMDFSIRNQDKKPILSDIKAKQFNSFSCFLLKDSLSRVKPFQKVKNLSEVRGLFSNFEQKVKDFDKINSKMIDKTKQDMEKLKPFLKKREHSLVVHLQSLASFFYWRDKKERIL